jgi:hypothetical protein
MPAPQRSARRCGLLTYRSGQHVAVVDVRWALRVTRRGQLLPLIQPPLRIAELRKCNRCMRQGNHQVLNLARTWRWPLRREVLVMDHRIVLALLCAAGLLSGCNNGSNPAAPSQPSTPAPAPATPINQSVTLAR